MAKTKTKLTAAQIDALTQLGEQAKKDAKKAQKGAKGAEAGLKVAAVQLTNTKKKATELENLANGIASALPQEEDDETTDATTTDASGLPKWTKWATLIIAPVLTFLLIMWLGGELIDVFGDDAQGEDGDAEEFFSLARLIFAGGGAALVALNWRKIRDVFVDDNASS